MISMRKQLFALLLCVGTLTILITALFVNATIHTEFKNYIEDNIQKTSGIIVRQLEEIYDNEGSWNETLEESLLTDTQIGKFSVAILNPDKELIWGKTKEELAQEIEDLEYPFFYLPQMMQFKDKIYTFQDIPIESEQYG